MDIKIPLRTCLILPRFETLGSFSNDPKWWKLITEVVGDGHS